MKTKLFFTIVIAWQLNVALVEAEALVGLTATNELVRFSSANPDSVTSTVAITGLTVGDTLAGIDVRPTNGLLYGLGVARDGAGAPTGVGRIYSIDLATGAATLTATLAADPADVAAPTPFAGLTGEFFGIDFNPVVDRLRVVSDTGLNLRLNVETGLTQLDVALNYPVGDIQEGTSPQVVGVGYTNSVAGAATTVLYGLDITNGGYLVTQSPPNDGRLNSTGILSLAAGPDSALDISGATGTAYVVLDGATLATVALASGDVTQLGAIATIGSITDIAVVVPEPSTLMLAAIISVGACATWRRRRCW